MKYKSLPINQLSTWATLNNAKFHGITISPQIIDQDGNDKGGGLLATKHHSAGDVLLTVPGDLVLTRKNIHQHAQVDRYLKEVLDAVGSEFSQDSRKIIMLFLLVQLTYSSPQNRGSRIGVLTPLTQYVEFLPKDIPLPTFYTSEERKVLEGTSLADALDQKTRSLEKEFERLRLATESVEWCADLWWDDEHGIVSLEDWKVADAMYRSRALELPAGVGDAMVPVVDMVNHTPEVWNARFEVDQTGNVLLVVRDNYSIVNGEEVTIVYGVGGACEMVFSYGFLDTNTWSAREMFLRLEMPSDDPLAMAKTNFSREAPGVRVYTDKGGQLQWDSAFAWWACVNEEDGLDFRILQCNHGGRELTATWKDKELRPSDDLRAKLLNDPMRDVFLLRATVLVQQRVEEQGSKLSDAQKGFDETRLASYPDDRTRVMNIARKLGELELKLLLDSYQSLEEEKARLIGSDTVRAFLSRDSVPAEAKTPEEDFS